jgi:DNA polymerase IIIc chi subunit
MKKTEDYIKPLVLDAIIPDEEELKQLKERYAHLRQSGELERTLSRLQIKQKRTVTTHGPHPHHMGEGASTIPGLRQVI